MSLLGVAREGHGMVSGLGMQFVLMIMAVILPEALKCQHGDWKWVVCPCGQDRQSYEGDIVRGGQLMSGRQGGTVHSGSVGRGQSQFRQC